MKFFDDEALPIIFKRDVDEKKFIAWIVSKTAAPPSLISEIIETNITLNKIARCEDCLTIPEGEVVNFLKANPPPKPVQQDLSEVFGE